MLIVYLYLLGARRQRWMPFWPPLLTVGKQLVNKQSHPTPLLHRPCVGMDVFIKFTPLVGEMAHHGGDVCGLCFVVLRLDFHIILMYKSYGAGVFVPTRTTLVVSC